VTILYECCAERDEETQNDSRRIVTTFYSISSPIPSDARLYVRLNYTYHNRDRDRREKKEKKETIGESFT